VIGLLEGMLGEDRLVPLVPAQRVAQTQRLRELARLVDQLVDPFQVAPRLDARELLEERTRLDLCAVSLGVFEQPVHKSIPRAMGALRLGASSMSGGRAARRSSVASPMPQPPLRPGRPTVRCDVRPSGRQTPAAAIRGKFRSGEHGMAMSVSEPF